MPTIPTTSSNYYIGISKQSSGGKAPTAGLYLAHEQSPMAYLPEMEEFNVKGSGVHPAHVLTLWAGRMLYVAQANTLVTFPETNDRIYLRLLDVEQSLKDSGVDYLLATSRPGGSVIPGSSFIYQIEVLSKHGGLTYTLESGVTDMSLSESGLLRWVVPAGQEDEVAILVRIKDATGQEIYHSFVLSPNIPSLPMSNL